MLQVKVLLEEKLPKGGSSVSEYEDALSSKGATDFFRVALADGATESSFAREWANILVDDFVQSNRFTPKHIKQRLTALRNKWYVEVSKPNLPWFAQIKLEKGAFSALLVVNIDLMKHSYSCVAIGDCCLFHVRGDKMVRSFPLLRSAEFSNSPFLLSTSSGNDENLMTYMKKVNDTIETGDYFFLASDALAHWFSSENEKEERPWEILLGCADDSITKSAFIDWLNDRRREKAIKNDDTTLLILEIK